MSSDSIVIRRGQLGRWAGYAGAAGLLAGVVGGLWLGAVTPAIVALLAAGVLGMVAWAALNPREFTDFITGRQVRHATASVFSVFLLVSIVALTYTLVARSALTLDMTEARRFTLSQQTRDILQGVQRPIRITGFYASNAVQMREVDDQIIRLYEAESGGRITRQYINPDEEPALAQRFGAYSSGALFLSYLNPDGSVDFGTIARIPRQTDGAQEREITQAIARLLIAGTFKVYFETSLGTLDPLDTSQQGLSAVHLGMQESGLTTAALDLAGLAASGGVVPDDAAAIIIARPTVEPEAGVLALIDDYLKRGGALLLLTDVQFSDNPVLGENSLFNEYLWAAFGLRALNAVVVDYSASIRTPLDVLGAAIATEIDIAARLDPEEAPTLFRLARSLQINSENPPVNGGFLIMSSPNSYGETDLRALAETGAYAPNPERDLPGPQVIAAWAWDERTDAKILLVGDSDFITNGYISSSLGNAILFTDGLAWLTGLSEQIGFSPRAFTTGLPLLYVTAEQLDLIALITALVMPGTVLLAGLLVWRRRGRQ